MNPVVHFEIPLRQSGTDGKVLRVSIWLADADAG
jgi:hypothetical protein